jgi:hypothetical protein
MKKTPMERYEKRIDKTDTCWLWTGSKHRLGYGRINVGKGKIRSAHVVVYEIHIGLVPEGLELDHLCRVRNCVNPDHLEPVTHEENIARATPFWYKTHCPRGHEHNEKNTYINPKGRRICRTCTNRQGREYEQRKKLRAIA